MPDLTPRPDRRAHTDQQDVLSALLEIREHQVQHATQLTDLTAKVSGLITWQEDQAQEDFERRTRETREKLRAEWEAEKATEEAARIEKQRQIDVFEEGEARKARAQLLDRFYLFISAIAALAGWDLVSSWEHSTLASVQTIVAVAIIALTVVMLVLGGRL